MPEIQQVEPFSSTAELEFEEPDSIGGVPIIKYRVEWRLPGQDWISREYDAKDGESPISTGKVQCMFFFFCLPLAFTSMTSKSIDFYKKSQFHFFLSSDHKHLL